MKLTEDTEVLEMLFVGLDPLEDGFVGVLVEVLRLGDRYFLLETAPGRSDHPRRGFLPWARSVERTKP